MKKFLLLFLTLTCAAVAQVKIDIGDIDWPNQSASQLFRRNAANNGFEFFTASPQLTLTGDATGTTTFTNLGNGSLALTLANSGVTANTYGSATQVPSFTVDAKGRITGVSLITSTPAWGSVTGKPTTAAGAGFTNGATIDSWGAKTVPTGTVADTDRVSLGDASRPAATGLYFDGATTSTRAEWNLGAAGALSGTQRTLIVPLYIPTASEVQSSQTLWAFSSASNNGAAANQGFYCYLDTNRISVRQYGPTSSDIRRWDGPSGFISANGGKSGVLVFTVDSAGNLNVYLNGALLTPTANDTVGAPSAWGIHSSSFFRLGGTDASFVWKWRVGMPELLNASLSAAQVLLHAQTGLLPGSIEASTGSMVEPAPFTNPSFEADTSSPPSGWTASGNHVATAVADGTAPSGNNVVEIVAAGAGPGGGLADCLLQSTPGSGQPNGRRWRLEFWAKAISGNTSLTAGVGGGHADGNFTITGSWTKYAIDFDKIGSFGSTRIFLGGAGTFRLDAIKLYPVGRIFRGVAQADVPAIFDSSENHITGFTVGVRAVSEWTSLRARITRTLLHSDISSTANTTAVGLGNTLPPGWIVAEQHVRVISPFDVGITLDTGVSGTSGKFVSARSLASTGFFRDVSASLVPESAAASTTVYWKKSGATTQGQVEITLILERIY